MTSYFRGKNVDTRLLENAFWIKKFLMACRKTSEWCKLSELPPNSHCAIYMMSIYKITEVTISVSFREHPDVTFAKYNAAAYTPCLGPRRRLISTAILLKFSQTNLKIMYIPKIEKMFWSKISQGLFWVTRLIYVYYSFSHWTWACFQTGGAKLAEGCNSWYYEIQVDISFTLYFTYNITNDIPPWGPGGGGGLSRECVLRIPSVIVKGD